MYKRNRWMGGECTSTGIEDFTTEDVHRNFNYEGVQNPSFTFHPNDHKFGWTRSTEENHFATQNYVIDKLGWGCNVVDGLMVLNDDDLTRILSMILDDFIVGRCMLVKGTRRCKIS